MKNLLIIYNVIFLLAGNVLFSNIHSMHHDHHHSEEHQTSECQECIIIENSNNYVLDFQEINFSNNYISLFVNEHLSIFKNDIQKIYLSRAPPIS